MCPWGGLVTRAGSGIPPFELADSKAGGVSPRRGSPWCSTRPPAPVSNRRKRQKHVDRRLVAWHIHQPVKYHYRLGPCVYFGKAGKVVNVRSGGLRIPNTLILGAVCPPLLTASNSTVP
jgi:hypothetical protein